MKVFPHDAMFSMPYWIMKAISIQAGHDADYFLRIEGKLISKKNGYQPVVKGFRKTQKIKDAEQMVALQIPGEMRGLNLEHPDLVLQVYMPKKSWGSDSDNGYTFLLDCLVANGVFKDDSVRRFNGTKVLLPVIESERPYADIVIWRKNNDKSELG